VADLLSRLPAPFVDLADDTPEATSQLHRLIATGRVEIDGGMVYAASGVLRDARNWRAIRDVVHQVDGEHRPGAKMADDDMLDVAVRALRKFPAIVGERDRLVDEVDHLRKVEGGCRTEVEQLYRLLGDYEQERDALLAARDEARATAANLARRYHRERAESPYRLPSVPVSPFDHGCAECCVPPYATDTVVPGFRCSYHRARDWMVPDGG
jgi:hypothetical protein